MSLESVFSNPSELIDKVRHPSEKPRFIIALIAVAPILMSVVWLAIATEGIAGLVIGFYLLLILFLIWFFGRMVRALLLMNMVEINEENFSDIYRVILKTKDVIGYDKVINAYLWRGSKVGLSILHQLDRKILVIDAPFLEGEPSEEILNFAVMFHVARLKTRSEYLSILTNIISGIQKIWLLNFILYPFERATVYTADRVAMIYVGKSEYAQQSLSREMVGNELGKLVNIDRISVQGEQCKGFFAWLARAYSSFPGYSQRFVELNKFEVESHLIMMERHQL